MAIIIIIIILIIIIIIIIFSQHYMLLFGNECDATKYGIHHTTTQITGGNSPETLEIESSL